MVSAETAAGTSPWTAARMNKDEHWHMDHPNRGKIYESGCPSSNLHPGTWIIWLVHLVGHTVGWRCTNHMPVWNIWFEKWLVVILKFFAFTNSFSTFKLYSFLVKNFEFLHLMVKNLNFSSIANETSSSCILWGSNWFHRLPIGKSGWY